VQLFGGRSLPDSVPVRRTFSRVPERQERKPCGTCSTTSESHHSGEWRWVIIDQWSDYGKVMRRKEDQSTLIWREWERQIDDVSNFSIQVLCTDVICHLTMLRSNSCSWWSCRGTVSVCLTKFLGNKFYEPSRTFLRIRIETTRNGLLTRDDFEEELHFCSTKTNHFIENSQFIWKTISTKSSKRTAQIKKKPWRTTSDPIQAQFQSNNKTCDH
jgi:hypothetical protein